MLVIEFILHLPFDKLVASSAQFSLLFSRVFVFWRIIIYFKIAYLQVPQTHAEWLVVAQEFKKLWQFLHFVGALDGKHVVIEPPQRSVALFCNYKGSFSIVLMALVDTELNFIFVDVGKNG